MVSSDRFIMGLIGLLVLAGFFASIGAMVVVEIPASNKEPLMLLVGSLGTMAGLVVGYWYGSSHGSSVKTDLLSQSQTTGKPGGG
jgi:membrane protein DedA with SNARE-associated domain